MRIDTCSLAAGSILALAGILTSSASAGIFCPGGATGCCFEAQLTPGCEDEDCCNLVCAINPFCCDTQWDGGCANEADIQCTSTPPCNDECDGATVLELPQLDLAYNTTLASTSAGPPIDPGCLIDGTAINNDLWYTVEIPADGSLFVNNCLSAGDGYDSILVVYTGSCGALTEIACNEDGIGCTGGSTISVAVTAGEIVYIRLGGIDETPGIGTLDVSISSDFCPGEGGDCCAANGTPGCDDFDCCTAVCNNDPFCCNVSWDGICSGPDGAITFCPKVCQAPECGDEDAGSCCIDNGSASCTDLTCCEAVCASLAECCDTEWDATCAERALIVCPDLCNCTLLPGLMSTPEAETCGDDTNGGCNSDPNAFGSISCGETIIGTAWADDLDGPGGDPASRDTDWYMFTVTETTEITASIVSELPTSIFFIDVTDCDNTVVFGDAGGGEGCEAGPTASAVVEPGSYVVFAGAGDPFTGAAIFEGFPCDTLNDYELTLTCSDPPSCPADVNGDGMVSVPDLTAVILAWGTADPDADVNNDGIVNVGDLTAIILSWGDC